MSYIALFQTCLNPAKNAKVDDIHTYLSGLTPTYASADFQYVKLDLDIEIKVDLPQEYQAVSTNVGNYALIQNESTGKQYFFFIMDAQWISKSCIKLNLSMDTINTFADDFTFDKKTTIIREHKDRYSNTGKLQPNQTFTFLDTVDLQDEGVNGAIQYRTEKNKIEDDRWLQYSNQRWYMVYTTPAEPTSTSPIRVRVAPENEIPLWEVSTQLYEITSSMLVAGGDKYYFMYADNPSGYFYNQNQEIEYLSSTVIGLQIYKDSDNTLYVYRLTSSGGEITRTRIIIPYPIRLGLSRKLRVGGDVTAETAKILSYPTVSAVSGSGIQYCNTISSINRTLSTTIKIIELPYAPLVVKQNSSGFLDLPDGWSVDDEFYLTTTATQQLQQTLKTGISLGLEETYTFGSSIFINRTMKDPKLKHSAFSTYKLNYDSFSLTIPLEQIQRSGWLPITMSVDYHQANTITSNLGFKVNYNNATRKEVEDYGEYLIANRNNESPIYTNAYLDYLRTGYNYDRKAQTRSNVTTSIQAGAAIAGAIVSFATAVGTKGLSLVAAASLGTTAITTTANAISNAVGNEQSIQQKIDETRNQASAIEVADDVDLLNWYNDNKLYINKYRVSDEVYNLMDDLFYYCGYAVNKQGIPDTTSRVFFNYIQCNPVFVEEVSHTYDAYLEDIKARYAAGVTVYHNVSGAWDFEQNMENWEIKLC